VPYPKIKEEHYSNFGGEDRKKSFYITQEGEALRLINLDSTKQGAWTQVPGTTLFLGATVSGAITSLTQFTRLAGQSYIIAAANSAIYSVLGGFNPIRSGLLNGALFDFVPFVDRLFCANGQDFFKTDGTVSTNFSLPPGASGSLSISAGASAGFTGYFQYAYGYLNDRGYAGPVSGPDLVFTGFTVLGTAAVLTGFTVPSGYGISAIIIYRSENNLASTVSQIAIIPAGQTTFTDTGYTGSPGASLSNLSDILSPPYIWFTLAPRYIELFNNQLFMAGFSSLQSTTYFSDIGEPEGVGITASFEVRTNDGDRITGMKAYNSGLMFFKQRSFHQLSGDNPQNFTLQELSDQYGCLSNRASAVFNDVLFFLDRKGVAQYNGANISIVSNRLEDVFMRMNIPAAVDNAAMIHVKERNEVWTLFPVDGATMNNMMVVYDYYSDCWYERHGLNQQSIALIINGEPYPTPFYGGYTGSIFNYGYSGVFGDNGNGMTCQVFTRFHSAGHSVENLWRRLWLDVTPQPPATGGTVSIEVDFYRNQDVTTPYLTRTMYGCTWQSRIDFGISAKSLAFQFSHFSDTQFLQINGYSVAHRFQRDV
jgi:hypothetical protein